MSKSAKGIGLLAMLAVLIIVLENVGEASCRSLPRRHHHPRHRQRGVDGQDDSVLSKRLDVFGRGSSDGPNSVDGFARHKRHNNRHRSIPRRMTKEEEKDFAESRRQDVQAVLNADYENEDYLIDVKEAQNSSICNYTVESIPDPTGTRIPRDLENVRCNHRGSRCSEAGAYCCIQTYRWIDVSYGDQQFTKMRILTGCVCALQLYNELQSPSFPTDE